MDSFEGTPSWDPHIEPLSFEGTSSEVGLGYQAKPQNAKTLRPNVGALIFRIGFWGLLIRNIV